MKIKQHLLLTAILLLCSAMNINAEIETGKCGENVTYSLDTESGLLEIKGTGEMGYSTLRNDMRVKEVKILDGVTSIGSSVFMGCSGLTSVTIPNSVTSIGFYAFSGCSGLTSVTIPNSVTSIGNSAFTGCSSLTSVTIPNSVTSIGFYAFSGCSGLTSVTISNSVTSIEMGAFTGCSSLTSVTIPASVTSIDLAAFSDCSGLTSISVDKGNSKYDNRENCNAIIETATNTLIAGCKNTVIPNSVTSIGGYAFSGCSGLTSITIPASVKSIGSYAFNNCSGLKTVICESADVPTCGYSDGASFVLYVPEESVAFYRSASGWNSASAIKPIEEAMKEVTTWAAPKVTITEAGIKFASDIKDGEYVYSIKDAMLTSKATTTNTLVPITNAYILSVYVKKGYEKSPTTTVYIDKNMKTVMGSGDVDGDGEISMADANAIVNKYLDK